LKKNVKKLEEEVQTKLKEIYFFKKKLLALQADTLATAEQQLVNNIGVKRVFTTLSKEKKVLGADKFVQSGQMGRTRCNKASLSCYQNKSRHIAKRLSLSGISSQKSVNSFLKLHKCISLMNYNNARETEDNELVSKSTEKSDPLERKYIDGVWEKVKEKRIVGDTRKILKPKIYQVKKANDIYRINKHSHQKRASISFLKKNIDLLNESLMRDYGI